MASTISAGTTTTTALSYSADTSGVLQLQTNGGTTAVTIDTSQNVGVGVTPSAWGSGYKAVQIQSGAVYQHSSTDFRVIQNAYYATGNSPTYINTQAASMYRQDAGTHYWYNAASGTAGNAITFTQAMTLDASGNLVIGDTSTSGRFKVAVADNASFQSAGTFTNNVNADFKIRIKSSVTDLGPSTATPLTFSIAGTEAARIDSSGNLLVGTTSNTAGVRLVIGGTSGTARVEPATDNVGYIGEGSYRWQAVYAVNGTIQTSDGREKNTIADSNLGLSFVQSLRPVSYKWNVGENVVTYDEEGKEVVTPRPGVRTHYGFIAQDVKAAIPEGVDFGGFVQEPDEGMMSLRYHEFIGPLVKAIQEQQAMITTLQTQVTALQAKG